MADYTTLITAARASSGDDIYAKPTDGNFSSTNWPDDTIAAIEISDTNVYEIVLDEAKSYNIYRNEHSQAFAADAGTDAITANEHGLINGQTLRVRGGGYASLAISVGSGDLAGNIINCTAHGYTTGMRVRFTGSSLPAPLVEGADYYVFTVPDANTFTLLGIDITGIGSGSVQRHNLPAPLVPVVIYFVRDATTNTFKLAATAGGSAINLAENGSGSMSFTAPSKRSKSDAPVIGTISVIKAATLTGEGEEAIAAAVVLAVNADATQTTARTNAATAVAQTAPAALRTAIGLESANLANLVNAVIGKKVVTPVGDGRFDIAVRNSTDTATLVTIRHNPVTGDTTIL